MATTQHRLKFEAGEPLLPGYSLEEQIGVGGFGEVWRVSAPGGLAKAAKVIFGNMLDERADREMRSLDRVKNVSHPFLLSVERIEVVAGQLVIITELADQSLKERYEACRADGLSGIPREELLSYIQEAADALDYLFSEFDLQHLDVKPENLLLAGGHIRVADFGLLKQLGDRSVSLVSGFTPQYTAPEVLDGRPSPQSDQYSLAVVFQQMATGHFPFDGKTVAAIASQHLHSKPDVSLLNPTERFAVSKALAKEPGRRFVSCTEFAKRLMHQSGATLLNDAPQAASDTTGTSRRVGAKRAESSRSVLQNSNEDTHHAHDGHTILVSRPETTALPALSLDTAEPRYRPTLFIGVGGTGGQILSSLRELLGERYGDVAVCRAIQFLYLDTDISSLNETEDLVGSAALREHETLLVPLRDAWDYRTRELNGIASISRRWIYNVPRSRRTEGLRALGRLAFLDHSKRILDRLRVALADAIEDDALKTTAATTGLPFDAVDPRVFIVASIAGGTGGGMTLDLAYAVRQILAETGLSDDHVIGLLTYNREGRPGKQSLGTANAYVFLEELQRFSLATADYPGESACGLFGFRESAPTFKSTYLAELSARPSREEHAAAIRQLARYLFINAFSPASAFFDLSRQSDREHDESGQLSLRTFGVAPLGGDNGTIRAEWIDELCARTVRTWLDGSPAVGKARKGLLPDGDLQASHSNESERASERVEALASDKLQSCGLNLDALTETLHGHLSRFCEEGVNTILKDAARQYCGNMASHHAEALDARRAFVSLIHEVFGLSNRTATESSSTPDSLRGMAVSQAGEVGKEIGTALGAWLLDLVETDAHGVTGVQRVAKQIGEQIDERQRRANQSSHAAQDLRANADETIADSETWRDEYVQLATNEIVAEAVLKAVTVAKHFVSEAQSDLWELATELNGLLNDFGTDQVARDRNGEDDASSTFGLSVKAMLSHHDRELVARVDKVISENLTKTERSFPEMLAPEPRARGAFLEFIRGAARNVIRQYREDLAHQALRQALDDTDNENLLESMQQCVQAAAPDLLYEAGGSTRILLVAPKELEETRLKETVEQTVECEATVVTGSGKDVTLCCEVESISVENVLNGLVRARPDCQELASRLHTRIDIDW